MTETEITQQTRVALAKIEGVTIWRNNSGSLKDDRGRYVKFGLGIGSADLVGVVRCDFSHLSRRPDADTFGRFFSLEVKTPGKKPKPDQESWSRVVRSLGGFYAVINSADDAVAAVERCRRGESA